MLDYLPSVSLSAHSLSSHLVSSTQEHPVLFLAVFLGLSLSFVIRYIRSPLRKLDRKSVV